MNWTPLKALLNPFSTPHEKAIVEGIHLVAQRNGANVVLKKSDSTVRIESLGDTIGQILEDSPKKQVYKLAWGDGVEKKGLGMHLRMSLLKSPEDRRISLF
ncbi:MAG: hypothetical protein AAGA53_11610 [Pseudomonadota bacterium]